MSTGEATAAPVSHADRFFIGGEWVAPSSDATIDVIDSGTEELYYTIAEAAPDDMSRAVAAARHAFDEGPWPRLSHARARRVPPRARRRAPGAQRRARAAVAAPVGRAVQGRAVRRDGSARGALESYAALADTFPFEEECPPTGGGEFGLLVREPVGVVGAIIPWNAPVGAHLPQDRSRAPRRLHGRAQVVAGGAG